MNYPLTKRCSFCFGEAEYYPFHAVQMCAYHFKKYVNGDLDKMSPELRAFKIRQFMESMFQ